MSTLRQIKRILDPVLKENPGLKLSRSWIVLKPLRHVAWTIWIQTSNDASFQLHWGPSPMFIPGYTISPLKRGIYPDTGVWQTSLEDIETKVQVAIENQCLPFLPAVPTLFDLYEFAKNSPDPATPHFYDESPPHGVYYYAAQGMLEVAIERCETIVRNVEALPPDRLVPTHLVAVRDLYPLLRAGDRKGIGALLRFHEERCIQGHRLEKLWRPAPYPVELQG